MAHGAWFIWLIPCASSDQNSDKDSNWFIRTRLRFRLTDQENIACFRNKIDIQREIEIEKETEIETCGSCTGQASRVDHKQRRTREQLSPFGQRARIHHPGHREQEARRYRGERSIDMASSLRQLLPLKRIPAVLGYARRPAPPPPPAAPSASGPLRPAARAAATRTRRLRPWLGPLLEVGCITGGMVRWWSRTRILSGKRYYYYCIMQFAITFCLQSD